MKDFINKLDELNLFMVVEDDNLVLKKYTNRTSNKQAQFEASKQDIFTFIKENKQGLISYLKEEKANGKSNASKDRIYKLSPLQEGLLFHGLYDPNSTAYTVQFSIDFLQKMNAKALQSSWEYVMKNHSVLRTAFFHEEFKIPVQRVFEKVTLPFTELDYSSLDETLQENTIAEFIKSDHEKGFSFNEVPLLRVTLIKRNETSYKMVFTFHHILLDGWSVSVLFTELLEAYNAFEKGQTPPEKSEDVYEDYVKYIASKDEKTEELFWKNYIEGLESATLLPYVKKGAAGKEEKAIPSESGLVIEQHLADEIRTFARKYHVTVNSILQGVWAFLLSKYTGNKDVVYGVTVSGRPTDLKDSEDRVGLYINTLPLRAKLAKEIKVTDWLLEIQKEHTACREYQYTNLATIQNFCEVKEELFDSILVFENYPVSEALSEVDTSLSIGNMDDKEQTNYPLAIVASLGDNLDIKFNYNQAVLSAETIKTIQGHFRTVLEQVIVPEQQIGKLTMLSCLEQTQLLQDFNNTAIDYSSETSIIDEFFKQVVARGKEVAVVFNEELITYEELDQKSNQLAHYLIQQGTVPGSLVGLCMSRSLEMMVGLIGILKAGAAYLPIDPLYPSDRIEYMLEDAEVKIVLGTQTSPDCIKTATSVTLVELEVQSQFLEAMPTEKPEILISSEDLAYAIYTSGSTGKPKGTLIPHRGVVRLSQMEVLPLGIETTILQLSSISFDAATFEIWCSLLQGGKLVLYPSDVTDLSIINNSIAQHKVNTIWLTSALFDQWVTSDIDNLDLRYILSGGDVLNPQSVAKVYATLPNVEVINGYGPTENTTFTCCYKIPRNFDTQKSIPIGAPIKGTTVYVLDEYMQPCPVGVVGELCTAGLGVSTGYLNQPLLTSEKFVTNPFNEKEKMYKTGDLVRWREDGTIEFVGRRDNQVKIRGFRIELSEIENSINAHAKVDGCCVLVKTDEYDNKRLVAYVVKDEKLSTDTLKSYLKTLLPEYMIPAMWVTLSQMPLTSNGKLDKKSLPEPDMSLVRASAYVAPTTELETELVKIWQELLGATQIGIEDNFFDLGGHSLLATRLVAMMRKSLKAEIAIKDVFTHPTISEQAAFLNKENTTVKLPEIQVQQKEKRSPLSYSQERLWFLDELQGSVEYHIPGAIKLQGNLNVDALEKTLKTVVTRHQILHTVIRSENGTPFQELIAPENWVLEQRKLQKWEHIETLLEEAIKKPFVLSEDYMFRATLYILEEGDYVLGFVLHHIAGDGWSNSILIKDVMELYQEYNKNITFTPEIPELQYRDYAIWQRKHISEEQLEEQLTYWNSELQGVAPLELPTDYTRPAEQTIAGFEVTAKVDNHLTKQLQELSKQEGVTLFMTLLTTFKVLLYKYSGQEDICVGTPIANRLQQELENMIGFFVNTLALRTEISGVQSFKNVLKEVKKTTLDAYDHQQVPFEKVVDKVGAVRDMSTSPLFQVMFVLQNLPETKEQLLDGINVTPFELEESNSHFDITLTVNEAENGELHLSFVSKSDLFKEETIQQMAAHYARLLKQIANNSGETLDRLEILSETEKQTLLVTFNQTEQSYPLTRSFVSLFEEQVFAQPKANAVVIGNEKISYEVLNKKSNQLANYLKKQGVIEGELVGVCIPRSVELLVAIVGILKAGGTYVPIDPSYPSERIEYILEDAQVKRVLKTSEVATERISTAGVEYLIIDATNNLLQKEAEVFSKNEDFDSNTIAYVIYTSGSTGKPKGVSIKHRSLLNLCCWHKETYKVTEKSRATLFSATGFDASIWEIFPYLISGATLYPIVQDEMRYDVTELVAFLRKNQITHAYIPSQLCQRIVQEEIGINGLTVLTGGEALQLSKPTKLTIYNNYGPTEDTVVSTYCKVSDNETGEIAIGKPMANTFVYVLDNHKQLVPIGVNGELFVSGEGVAAGYLNNEELTKEKFIKNPFQPEKTMYATGDMVKWSADGVLHFSGRKDEQVKIRGHRIELGEIENVLQGFVSGLQVIVTAQEDATKNKRLVGYWVDNVALDKEELINYAKTKLPDYMVPVIWIPIQSIPVTTNGKVNKKELPHPDFTAIQTVYVAPKNETEQVLCKIWQDLLAIEKVGTTDDFFQLGGHSLLAARVVAAIRTQTQLEVTVKDIFRYPTVAELATYVLNKETTENVITIEKVTDEVSMIPLSFSQERLWFLDQLEGSIAYHMPSVFSLEGELDLALLEESFLAVIERHHALRTVIKSVEGIGHQKLLPWQDWKLQSEKINAVAELTTGISEFIARPFNLANDYMIRAAVFQKSETSYVLVFVTHHIASDGWSNGILQKELVYAYNQYVSGKELDLEPVTIQYADYAVWQRNRLSATVLNEQLTYWEKQLKGTSPLLLPTDFDRPAVPSTSGAILSYELNTEIKNKLEELVKKEASTTFMTMLAAFNVLLYKYTGQNDVCVGTPIANRTHTELEEVIGFFANTLALRSNVEGEHSFKSLLQQVKTTTLNAYTHQDTPFEKVVDRVVENRDRSMSPLFQVMFVLQNTPDEAVATMNGVTLNTYETEDVFSQFDVTLTANETAEGISLNMIYNSDLFREATMMSFIQHYEKILIEVIQKPEALIKNVDIIPSEEKRNILTVFNNTEVVFSGEKNLVDAFREQVLRTPEAIAVVYKEESLSYAELDAKSDQLAMCLQYSGVEKDTLVCICTERSSSMLISILGVLKAGAAYVPIDPSYPAERIHYILEDTQASVLIKDATCLEIISEEIIQIDVDADWKEITKVPAIELPAIQPSQLAYVIYTSGSTGKPKGVMIEHQGIMNTIYAQIEDFNINEGEHCLQFASQSFDASVSEIFTSLIKGATLYIIDEDTKSDLQSFVNYIKANKIDCATLPPAFFRLLEIEDLKTIKTIVTAGEQAAFEKAKAYAQVGQFINAYGPTEASICATLFKEKFTDFIPIGRPLANAAVYILDNDFNVVPVGVPGELCISGAGVARGYLNRPELTAEKFVENPFNPGIKMYLSGDLAKWLPDGNLLFLGRKDDQVKVRGYRIELGEIENVLSQFEKVQSCCVLAKKDQNNNNQLVGYVVKETSAVDKNEIQEYLKALLPDYMVPAQWVFLEEMPLTTNGKINKKKLPDVDTSISSSAQYVAPSTEIEEALVNVWKELLTANTIGVKDNFFELGGDSIITIQLVSRVKRLGYQLKPRDIFDYQTIEELAQFVVNQTEMMKGEQGVLEGTSGLLPIQHWYFNTLHKEGGAFNQSVLLSVDKKVTAEVLEEAVKLITNYHDALRFTYQNTRDNWKQQYSNKYGELVVVSMSESERNVPEEITEICNAHQKKSSVENTFQAVLLQTPEKEERNRLLLVGHHLVIDGVSWRILLDDFARVVSSLVAGELIDLGGKGSSYREWYSGMHQYANSPAITNQQYYWKKVISAYKPLPVDFECGEKTREAVNNYQVSLPEEYTQKLLQDVHHLFGTEINDLLLSSLALTIGNWTKNNHVVIGLEGHGRENISETLDVSNTVGWFTNVYPVRLEVTESFNIADAIKSVKETLRNIPEKGMGYGALKYLHENAEIKSDLSGDSYDIVFNYLGQLDNVMEQAAIIEAAQESPGTMVGEQLNFDNKIEINGSITEGKLQLSWSYSAQEYKQVSIEKIAQEFITNLQAIIEYCSTNTNKEFTPSDYGLQEEINYKELEEFTSFLEEDLSEKGSDILEF